MPPPYASCMPPMYADLLTTPLRRVAEAAIRTKQCSNRQQFNFGRDSIKTCTTHSRMCLRCCSPVLLHTIPWLAALHRKTPLPSHAAQRPRQLLPHDRKRPILRCSSRWPGPANCAALSVHKSHDIPAHRSPPWPGPANAQHHVYMKVIDMTMFEQRRTS